jgi:transposase
MHSDCTPTQAVWVGVDIAKEHVDFFVLNRKDNPRGRRPQRVAALAQLARELVELGVTHALLEATGGLERQAWAAFEAAGILVTVTQPSRVRHFARAAGVEAKTDQLDAGVAARFGEALSPEPTPLSSPALLRYRELLRQLNYFVQQRAQLRTRRHSVHEALVRQSLDRMIKAFGSEIDKLEKAVVAALAKLPAVAAQAERLQQAAGVGPKTAWALTAELPELGTLTGGQAAALAGLAPRARDSGSHRGRRWIGGGRGRLRTALYMAARTAVRVDSRLRAFYLRLQAAGKPKQLGLIAVARRLLVMLNAMIRDGSDWRAAPVA